MILKVCNRRDRGWDPIKSRVFLLSQNPKCACSGPVIGGRNGLSRCFVIDNHGPYDVESSGILLTHDPHGWVPSTCVWAEYAFVRCTRKRRPCSNLDVFRGYYCWHTAPLGSPFNVFPHLSHRRVFVRYALLNYRFAVLVGTTRCTDLWVLLVGLLMLSGVVLLYPFSYLQSKRRSHSVKYCLCHIVSHIHNVMAIISFQQTSSENHTRSISRHILRRHWWFEARCSCNVTQRQKTLIQNASHSVWDGKMLPSFDITAGGSVDTLQVVLWKKRCDQCLWIKPIASGWPVPPLGNANAYI